MREIPSQATGLTFLGTAPAPETVRAQYKGERNHGGRLSPVLVLLNINRQVTCGLFGGIRGVSGIGWIGRIGRIGRIGWIGRIGRISGIGGIGGISDFRLVGLCGFFGILATDQRETTDSNDHEERCELLHLTTFS